MEKAGFYVIKDSFFEFVNDPYLKGNKAGNRPHYYCFKDDKSGLYWMIPLSSRIDKFKKIMDTKIKKTGRCDIIHIMKLDNDKESAFLLQDMFPITEDFIERKYTIAGNHLKVTSEHQIAEIDKKAKRVKKLLEKGICFTPTQPNVKKVENILKERILFAEK